MDLSPPSTTAATSAVIRIPVTNGGIRKLSRIVTATRIALRQIPDPERGQHRHQRKENGEPFAVHSVLNGIHGASADLAVRRRDTISDGKHAFRIFGCNPEHSTIQHQKNGAPGPPSAMAVATPMMFPVPIVAGKCDGERPERRNVPQRMVIPGDRKTDGLRNVFLNEAKTDRQIKMRSNQQDQKRRPQRNALEFAMKSASAGGTALLKAA